MKRIVSLTIQRFSELPRWLRLSAFIILLSIPVIVWVSPFVFTGGKISYMDNDYYFQLYEALRISIVKYHQFPWLNPWIVGGVPLFGNVQLGFPAIQVPFVLIFGTITGIKISWLLYYLLGFWGCFLLFNQTLKADKLKSALLAYLFVFCGYFALHIPGGHYTFALYFLSPWLIWLYFTRIDKRYGWLWFAGLISLLVLSSPHYAAIQSLIVVAVVICADVIINLRVDRLKKLALAGIVVLGLTFYRMYFVYQYIKEFPRAQELLVESPIPVRVLMKALILPISHFKINYPVTHWGWGETGAYIGIITLSLFVVLVVSIFLYMFKKKKLLLLPICILIGIILTVVIAKGDFGILSPFGIMKHLPILSGMRIPARWLIWSVLGILSFIACVNFYQGNRNIRICVNAILFVALLEVGLLNFGFATAPLSITPLQVRSTQAPFEQYSHFITSDNYDKKAFIFAEFLYEGTINNYGQVIAAESLVDTRTLPTIRCGINEGCPFVMSQNANVDYWSPNRIVLTRTRDGVIELNMNPSKYWLVNGQRIFAKDRVAEPSEKFIITDSSKQITLEVVPKYSIEYWLRKF